jgi:uncharacterized membrane-anchored protein YjiN (DUF445 family)
MLTIDIKPEDIDRLVKEAVTKSMIGTAIQATVSKVLSGYDSPIDKAIKDVVSTVALQLMREKFGALISEIVAGEMERKVTKEVLDAIVNTAMDKLIQAAQRNY